MAVKNIDLVFLVAVAVSGLVLFTLRLRRDFAEGQYRRYGHWNYVWFWIDLVGAEHSVRNWVRLCRVAAVLGYAMTIGSVLLVLAIRRPR